MPLIATAFQQALQAMMGGNGDDEAAIDDAVDTMYAMVGNEGQETIVATGEEPFREWAQSFLENPEEDEDPYVYLEGALSEEQLAGTEEIWAEGTRMVQEQSLFHDSEDEEGEGTGVEVGSGGGFETFVALIKKVF